MVVFGEVVICYVGDGVEYERLVYCDEHLVDECLAELVTIQLDYGV